jgi:hypothetical protein
LCAVEREPAMFQDDTARAKRLDRCGVVADEDHRAPRTRDLADLARQRC